MTTTPSILPVDAYGIVGYAPDNIYSSVAADFSAVVEKIPRRGADPLPYISQKRVENFSDFFTFSDNSADNALFLPQRMVPPPIAAAPKPEKLPVSPAEAGLSAFFSD